MDDSMEEQRKRCHLAQLRNAVSNFSNPRIIKKILATGVDVNHKFPINSSEPERFTTSLHLAATKSTATNFETLLDHGADMTIKDADGLTALHHLARECWNCNKDAADERPNSPFISAALSAHVKSNNFANPRDAQGFTHFHVACLTNHAEAVRFFLNHGVDVDEAVSEQSSLFPGYTPLHFAARLASLEAAEVLLSRGAAVRLRDATGMSAAQLLVQRKIAMLELADQLAEESRGAAVLQNISDNEAILKRLLLLDSDHPDIGMCRAHAICTLQTSALAAQLLQRENVADVNARVDPSSALWPGYTMLHFAAHCNVNTMLLLLRRGANIRAVDANGLTPFDICAKWCSLRDLHGIVSRTSSWRGIVFSDGRTKLLDCIAAMRSVGRFEALLRKVREANVVLPADSPLWPGFTLLHLSVTLSGEGCAEKGASAGRDEEQPRATSDIVRACLDFGAAVGARELRGRTAAHLAFRAGRCRALEMLLRLHREDARDHENLSLLHVACATRNKWPVDQWLRGGGGGLVEVDPVYEGGASLPNLRPGWTPLHAVVWANADCSLAEMLLQRGADPCRADESGLTPVHLLLLAPRRIEPKLAELLLARLAAQASAAAAAARLAHLHVASFFDSAPAVERLLDLGADVDAASSLRARFPKCTALHLATASKSRAAVRVLLRRGADALARAADGSSPLSKALTSSGTQCGGSLNAFVGALRGDQALRRRAQADSGLTTLHVVCRAGHVDAVRDLLSRGARVNARMRDDSAFWPGWTPLHVLVATGVEEARRKSRLADFKAMLQALLEHGAEVTIADAHGDTPLHLMLKKYPCDTAYFVMTSLLSRQTDFGVNPANADGATHFHVACLANDLAAVEKFLAAGIGVNRAIDYFAEHYAGSTPLHLALNSNSKRRFGLEHQLRTLDLLMAHKPDLNAQDDHAYTPLHVAADCDPCCVPLLRRLIDNGADIEARTIDGKTAFEILLSSKEISVREIELLVQRGYGVNGCNPMTDRGHLAIILNERNYRLRGEILAALLDAPSVCATDQMGRGPIHNIVATDDLVILEHDYVELIDKLIRLGCDLNDQDHSGMTALHLAAVFRNKRATAALLICGADINAVDHRGRTAFCCALEPCSRCLTRCNTAHDDLLEVLVEHAHRLRRLGLHVSEANERAKARALQNRWIERPEVLMARRAGSAAAYDKSREVDSIRVGARGWTLRHFLREHGAVEDYRTLTLAERRAVDGFFETLDYHGFRELRCVLKLQYRQAVARAALVEPAIAAIQNFLGVPSVCAELIARYLRSADMRNLIAAADSDH